MREFDLKTNYPPEAHDISAMTTDVQIPGVDQYEAMSVHLDNPYQEEEYIDAEYTERASDEIVAIDSDTVFANKLHDRRINERFQVAQDAIEAVVAESETTYESNVARGNEIKAEAQRRFEASKQRADFALAMHIAALQEQHARIIEGAMVNKLVEEEGGQRIIDEAGTLREKNAVAIDYYRQQTNMGVDHQARHEQRRDAAQERANELTRELVRKRADLATNEENRIQIDAALYADEEYKQQLLGQKRDLEIEERMVVDVLTRDDIRQFLADRGRSLEDPNLPDGFVEAIKQIKRDVAPNMKLSGIRGKLSDVYDSLTHTKKSIDDNTELLEKTDRTIVELKKRIEELVVEIEGELEKYRLEVEEFALGLERHSLTTEFGAKALYAVNNGDTSAVTEGTVHPSVGIVRWHVSSVQKAIGRGADGTEGKEIELKFDEEILSPLTEPEVEEKADINELAADREDRLHTAETFSRSPMNWRARIAGKFGRGGLEVAYTETQNQIEQ